MAIYHYKDSSLIRRVEVSTPRVGITQATIVAADGADDVMLEDLRKKLGGFDFSTLMDTVEGHAAIQVRGIKDEETFLAALEKLDLAKNGVEKDLLPDDQKKGSFGGNVRGKSLFLSAWFYNLGNLSLGISGIQRGRHNHNGKFTTNDWSELLTGGAFALGDVLLTYYGKDRGDEELSAASWGLKRHLHQKGIEIPEGDELNADSLHQSGLIKTADRWLHKHIGSVKCLTELTGGLFMIHSGLKLDQATQNRNMYKVAAGGLITAAWAATFLLGKPRGHHIFNKHNLIDGEEPEPETLIEKIMGNPRAWIAAPLAMGNNVINLVGANKERMDGLEAIRKAQNRGNRGALAFAEAKQHDYLLNVLTACSFLVAHSLFGMSGSRRPHETEDDKRIMHDLILMSANVLAKQPEKIREASIDETADYVSKLAHVGLGKEDVAKALRGKVEDLNHSSWAARIQATPDMNYQGRI